MNSAADLIAKHPGKAGALLAVGGAGAYFLRRRRSKTGKMIVEQVRR
jgi:MYXO-CTERM domain-containing protein